MDFSLFEQVARCHGYLAAADHVWVLAQIHAIRMYQDPEDKLPAIKAYVFTEVMAHYEAALRNDEPWALIAKKITDKNSNAL